MPKHLRFLIIIAVIVAILLILTYLINVPKSGFPDMEFSVRDTGKISKIFMANQQGFAVTLTRKKGTWFVNDKYECRQDAIKNLLDVLYNVRVKAPVPQSAKENILKLLSYNSIKVEVYTDNDKKPYKVFYIDGPTPNHDGTFGIIEGGSHPFILYMEGHYGFLTPFFFVEEHLWRSRNIWKYKYYEIFSVSVRYPHHKEDSYEIIQKGEQQVEVSNPYTGKKIDNIDTMKVYRYLALFRDFQYDYLMPYSKDTILPKLKEQEPVMTVKIIDFSGKESKVELYPKPAPPEQITFEGETPQYDIFGMYGVINDTELATIQYVMIDKIRWRITDFQKNIITEKPSGVSMRK